MAQQSFIWKILGILSGKRSKIVINDISRSFQFLERKHQDDQFKFRSDYQLKKPDAVKKKVWKNHC